MMGVTSEVGAPIKSLKEPVAHVMQVPALSAVQPVRWLPVPQDSQGRQWNPAENGWYQPYHTEEAFVWLVKGIYNPGGLN